ncbi:MAG: orotidine-5'-phosphate decarboxylase [Alphaproteobacteria bacterium GM7ARS4]|nr:orotidine-5'-phosphate decarboxylase [Alphaproteobacteria bacterium GM7ARS4]
MKNINGTGSHHAPHERPSLTPRERLIVALDGTLDEARALVASLGEDVVFYKIGWRCFLQGGWDVVHEIIRGHKRLFLDLKIHDIDATVRLALHHVPSSVALMTLYGNGDTMRAACEGRGSNKTPALLSLTWLSSMDEKDFQCLAGAQCSLTDFVIERALSAYDAGADGVIASGDHIGMIRHVLAKRALAKRALAKRALAQQKKTRPFLIVAPGVRMADESRDDHKRALTPYEAIKQGADYIVMGRSIARCLPERRVGFVRDIIRDIKSALEEREAKTDTQHAPYPPMDKMTGDSYGDNVS